MKKCDKIYVELESGSLKILQLVLWSVNAVQMQKVGFMNLQVVLFCYKEIWWKNVYNMFNYNIRNEILEITEKF